MERGRGVNELGKGREGGREGGVRTHACFSIFADVIESSQDGSSFLRVAPPEADGADGGVGAGGGRA
jgi:hypothetical protein